jgi:hypothetical protein
MRAHGKCLKSNEITSSRLWVSDTPKKKWMQSWRYVHTTLSTPCFTAYFLTKAFSSFQSTDLNKDGKISYPEFLASFRAQALALPETDDESTDSENNSKQLMGLDAEIPGGRFDKDLSESLREQLYDD